MGGNALTIPTKRYKREDFFDILLEVRTMLNNNGITSEVPKWYRNKETFGDLDVLIKSSTVDGNILDVINRLFKPQEIYNNNDVKSFDYKEFQIDFIMTSDDKWDTSINYFSYNDLGNLIGRISYQMGFRFGHFGLKLVYNHPKGGRKMSKIVSKNPRKIYEFLGFNYDRYLEGFDDLEDIFKFVVNSRYFNRKIYDYEYLNHQNRTRNKKRKNYELFLDYVKTNKNILFLDYEFRDKQYYINEAEKFFNIRLNEMISRFNEKVEIEKMASEKFNGGIVMEKYGLKGKEIGIAMSKFNNHITRLQSFKDEDMLRILRAKYIVETDINDLFDIFEEVNDLKGE